MFFLDVATTVGHGNDARRMTEDERKKYHGTGFVELLESIAVGQSFTDLDPVGRAHLLGVLQGIELVKTGKLGKWDLSAPFYDFEL